MVVPMNNAHRNFFHGFFNNYSWVCPRSRNASTYDRKMIDFICPIKKNNSKTLHGVGPEAKPADNWQIPGCFLQLVFPSDLIPCLLLTNSRAVAMAKALASPIRLIFINSFGDDSPQPSEIILFQSP